jgi:uncharacterized protein YjbI with pentapeptide repeats
LKRAVMVQADLRDADLSGADLQNADLSGAALDGADLRGANLRNVNWQHIKSIKDANIAGLADAPAGFADWAMANGAVNQPAAN